MSYLKWEETNYKWGDLNVLWEIAHAMGGDIHADPVKIEKLPKDKKKKLVRLIMHMNDIKVYDEKKEIKKLKHRVDDIKLIAEEFKKYVQIIHG